jgi:hypothetical protein
MRSKHQLSFGPLERERHRANLKFEEVIREIFSRWNDVHPSFASKLISAVNSAQDRPGSFEE